MMEASSTTVSYEGIDMVYAEQRSDKTQYELGQMFTKGPDDNRDYKQAANWFDRSARKGNVKAQYKLGLMYSRGLGVTANYVRAYAWLKIAAAQGSAKARNYLHKVAEKIPSNRLAEAHRLSHEYYEKYVAPFSR